MVGGETTTWVIGFFGRDAISDSVSSHYILRTSINLLIDFGPCCVTSPPHYVILVLSLEVLRICCLSPVL